MALSQKLIELIRNQVPYAASDLRANPLLNLMTELYYKVETLDVLVPRVLGVAITGDSGEIVPNNGSQLAAVVTVQAAASQDVTWSLEDIVYAGGQVAGVFLDQFGLVEISAEPLLVGTTFTVTATSDFDPTKSASVSFEVVEDFLVVLSTDPVADADVVVSNDTPQAIAFTFDRNIVDNSGGALLVDALTVNDGTGNYAITNAAIVGDTITFTVGPINVADRVVTVTLSAAASVAGADSVVLEEDYVYTFNTVAA